MGDVAMSKERRATAENGGKRIDHRLAVFAMHVNNKVAPAEAMRLAGYSPGNIDHGATAYVERARALGLLVDPAAIQDAVAIIEQGLADLAREIVRVGKGERPRHGDQLDWIREAFDRSRGKPKTRTEVTGKDGEPVKVQTIVELDVGDDPRD